MKQPALRGETGRIRARTKTEAALEREVLKLRAENAQFRRALRELRASVVKLIRSLGSPRSKDPPVTGPELRSRRERLGLSMDIMAHGMRIDVRHLLGMELTIGEADRRMENYSACLTALEALSQRDLRPCIERARKGLPFW